MTHLNRRDIVKGLLLAMTAGVGASCASTKGSSARVVVVGGGFAGMSCARTLKKLSPTLAVTLVEPKQSYIACPFSNLVIGNQRDIASQTFGYTGAVADGVTHIRRMAVAVDPDAHNVTLDDGQLLGYDKLVLAPGISLDFGNLPGYDDAAANNMPHAWLAGTQTTLLARQLAAMDDGGTVVISVPENPYRCPPGPYERASLIANYLQVYKPKSKLLILDSKDRFSKQALFMAAWKSEFGDLIEWQGLKDGARVVSVDPAAMTLTTDFDVVKADVANVIPPQRAGKIAKICGVTNASGWCPISASTFESSLHADIHVIGDAAIANAMPKSAFAANSQAKLCALQIARLLSGQTPVDSKLINTCYSLVTPDYGISVAGVYKSEGERWLEVDGAGGVSTPSAPRDVRRVEAQYARQWYKSITQEVFG
jgi:NADPH-dependent 2,4-dienoyl-CoA reductase/sulfur reductase-like enzyme